jgi:hypothetical protein
LLSIEIAMGSEARVAVTVCSFGNEKPRRIKQLKVIAMSILRLGKSLANMRKKCATLRAFSITFYHR